MSSSSPRRVRKHADGQDRRRSGGALTPGSFESRGDDLVSSFSSASSHSSGSVSVGASSSSASAVSVDIEHLLSVSFSKFKSRDKLVRHFQELHAQLDTFPREGQRTPSTKSLAKQLLEPRIFSHSDELVRAWVAFHCVHAVRLNPNRKVYNKAQTAKVFDRLNQEVRNNVNMQDHELFSVRFRMIETIEKTEVYVELFDTLCEQDIQGDHLEDDNNDDDDDDDDDDDRTLLEEEGDNKHRKKKKKKKKRKKKKKNRHSMGKKATDYIVDFADALLTSITHQHPDSYENLIEQLLVNVFDEMADGNTLVQEMLDVVLRHLIMELREDGSGEGGGGAAGYSLILKGGDGTLERTKAEPRSVKIVQVLVADLYDSCATSIIAFVNGVLAGTDTSNSDLAAHVHSLVYELWRIQCMAEDMDFMMTIIPRISEQLESPDMATRLKAVACLGKVFTAGHDTLIKSHTTSFRVLMRRFCDSQAPVREELCRVISRLLIKLSISRQAQHEDTIAICADRLVKLLNDKDQTVRKTAVTVVGKMAYDQGVMPLLPENLVKTLVGRCMDKDPDVNHTASVSIAKTFREHMVQNWPDDWDATLGSTSFYAHLSKEITHKLAGVPGALVDFYNNSLGLGKGIAGPASSSSSSLTRGLSASSLVWEDNKNKAIIRAGFISRVFDETLVTRKGSLQKRAQMLVAIFNQFSPTQRTAFGRILRDRGHMAKTLNGLMDEALERGSTLKLSAGASSSSSSSGSSGKKEKGRVTFASVSASQIKLKNDLIKLVGETVAENVTAALISSHRDRNIYKSVKVLCDPTCLVRRLSDKRKRLLSQLKVAQGDTSAAALEQCGQSLNAVLQTISLGGVVSCTQDSIVEIIAIARQCAEEGDMGKALATTELLSHITDMSQSYAYYSFDQITEYFMELSDPDAMADDGVDDDYASEDDDDRASLGRSRVGQHQRRSEPTRSERDEILLLILGIFSRALTRKVWGNSHANQNAPAKQAKILRTKDVRKRLMRLCLDGDSIALAEAAACAYGGMLLGTKSSSRDWQKAIQEVRDGLNVGGNLTMAPAGRKKTNSKSGLVDFQSGSFPIAAAAALPVLLEMAPSSGSTITEADNLFLDTCKEIQENALTQLTAETTSLSTIGKKSAKPEESGSDDDDDDDDVEDSSSDDEEDDSNDEDEDDKEEGNGLQGEMQSRPSGEHAHVCVMLLLRALRVRFKRRYGKNSISALHQDEARRILGRVYDILEDESMPVRAREGCMEAIFTFASGVTQSVCDVLTPRAYYAIGHYMLSRHIESSDRLSILSRVRKLCMQPGEHRRAHFGTLCNSMEFASLGVLCGSSLCNGSDCKSAEEEFEALIGFLRQKMMYFVRKYSQSSEKRRRRVTRKHLPERILQFGIAMIAHFSPGVETEGAAFDDKQRMVNFLLKPFLNESNNNYALMVNMAQQIRSGHNVSDLHLSGESSNNHALVAEMCKKSYISYRNKTKSMSFDAAELPPAVHIDKHWFRKVAVGNSSFAPSRYLAKGWEPKTPGRRRASTGVGISPIRAAGVSPISRKRKSNSLSGEKNEGKKKSKVIEDGKSKRQSNTKSFLQAKGKSEGDDDLPTKNEKEVEEDDLAIYEDAAADYEEDNDNDDDVDMLNDEEDNDASRKQASKTSAQKHEKPAPKENTVNASAPSEAAPSNPPRRRRRRRRGNY